MFQSSTRRWCVLLAAMIVAMFVFASAAMASTDLALNAPAVASSTFSTSYPASQAVDGNTSTRWAAAANKTPDTLQVELSTSYYVNEVDIQWGTDYPTSYQIQTSGDGSASSWQTIYSTTSGNGGTDVITLPNDLTRFLRVVGLNQNDSWGNSIYNLSVYGTAPTVTPPPPPPPTTTGAVVAAAPTGPNVPSGGWNVVEAEGFGGCLTGGTCQVSGAPTDNTMTLSSGNPSNSNEPTWYVPAQNVIEADGLHQRVTYQPNISTGKNYAAAELTTSGAGQMHFDPGQGQTWVFEMVAKLPPTTGEEDPAYWMTCASWSCEIDTPEFWGWHTGSAGKDWTASNGDGMGFPAVPRSNGGGSASGESTFYWNGSTLTYAPDAAFHRYTVEMIGTTFYSWLDGKPMAIGKTIGSVGAWSKQMGKLILQHSLRDPTTGNPSPYFMSGYRDFTVRSIALYQNASANYANTQNAPNIAPGTSVQ